MYFLIHSKREYVNNNWIACWLFLLLVARCSLLVAFAFAFAVCLCFSQSWDTEGDNDDDDDGDGDGEERIPQLYISQLPINRSMAALLVSSK